MCQQYLSDEHTEIKEMGQSLCSRGLAYIRQSGGFTERQSTS